MTTLHPCLRVLRGLYSSSPAVFSALALSLACSGGGSTNESSGGNAGTSGGSSSQGGAATGLGGSSNGGSVSANGGSATSNGGSTTASGGSAAGGSASGGSTPNGGSTAATGGATAGGMGSGGAANGGAANGGSSNAGSSGNGASCPTANEDKFSFFLISNAALIRESGKADGFGGDLGGITGADKICQRVAEYVSPCQSNKVWHAFLSTTTENAIDRIGSGPWYDRNGRVVSTDKQNLVMDRPGGADAAIKNDLPNENGVLNQNPDGTGQVDNHEILTGSGTDGKLYTQSTTGAGSGSTACGADVGASGQGTWSAERATCWNWTRATAEGCPRVGHSWPRQGSGTNWISVWNESGCSPGGTLSDTVPSSGPRAVGSFGGYGGFYCFAVIPHP